MTLLMLALLVGLGLALRILPLAPRPAAWQRNPLRIGTHPDPRTVLVTGATGFIGQHVSRRVLANGDRLIVLSRDRNRAQDLFGPHATIHTSLENIAASTRIDVVVNLAGESIITRRWSSRRRQLLLESRLAVTNAIVQLIARLEHKPRVFISASAVGYYGVRGDEEITERDRARPIFQSHLCQTWELAAQKAGEYGVRVCRLRLGVVLGRDGGALPQQVLAARARIRTRLGDGQQWLSWIHITDVLRLIDHCITSRDVDGPVNATAPFPVRQAEFAATLEDRCGAALELHVPALWLRWTLGERAQLLVDGQRVVPLRAQCCGFEFQYPTLDRALFDLTQPAQVAAPSEVVYDSLCPVCDSEMKSYCRSARRSGYAWQFDDVARRPDLMARFGLDLESARKRVYVLDDSGRLISGIDALTTIWTGLPGWRVLGRLVSLPGVKPIASWFYDLILAPAIWRWNQRRREALRPHSLT